MATTMRWETARQALARAEASTGVRTRLPRTPLESRDHAHNAPAIPASAPALPVRTPAVPASTAVSNTDHLPVPAAMLELFPDGGLARGSVLRIGGAFSVLFALAATAMGREGWSAFVGIPDAGLAAAAGMGLALQRVVVVPEPGAEAPDVLAALVDGVDVVVLGSSAGLTGQDRRRLQARLRRRGAVLLTTGTWEQPDVQITALSRSWYGVGQGDGLLRHGEVELQSRCRRRPVPSTCRVRVGRTGLLPAFAQEEDDADVRPEFGVAERKLSASVSPEQQKEPA